MSRKGKVLGVIIARGGSKGLPNKNLQRLGGHSLVALTVMAARRARTLDRVVLSTDAPTIARIGQRYGAEVPFLRPKDLARDSTHTPAVIQHAVRALQQQDGYQPELIVTLQPTSPFRRPDHIDRGVEMLRACPGCDAVIAVAESPLPPYWAFHTRQGRLIPFVLDGTDYFLKERQQLRMTVHPTGALYVTRRRLLMEQGCLVSAFNGCSTGYLMMDRSTSLDIDHALDLEVARAMLRSHSELAWWR